jgi:cytochrome c553
MKNRRLHYRTRRGTLPGALLATLMTALLAAAGAHAEGDAKAGQVKSIPCMGCHGIPGYSNVYPTYHVPRVGGQHPEYIVAALKAYKAKERSHPTMQAQASSLSEEDMNDIAAFFSAQAK